MKHSLRAVIIALMLAVGLSIPTTSKAAGLVEYGLLLVLVYGVAGDSVEGVYQLDHAGAVEPNQPNCSFEGTAEIEFIEVASGHNMEPESTDVVLTEDLPIQFDKIAFPASSGTATMAAVLRLSGRLPANCSVITNHLKSKSGGQAAEIGPSARVGLANVVERGDFSESPIDGIVFILGEGQVANLGLVANHRSVAPGQSPGDCRLAGTVIVTRLDNGQEPVEIPFQGDPLAILHDVTDAAADPPLPGSTATYRLIVENSGPSLLDSRPPCEDLSVTLGVADQSSGQNSASTYVNVHSARNLSGEIR